MHPFLRGFIGATGFILSLFMSTAVVGASKYAGYTIVYSSGPCGTPKLTATHMLIHFIPVSIGIGVLGLLATLFSHRILTRIGRCLLLSASGIWLLTMWQVSDRLSYYIQYFW